MTEAEREGERERDNYYQKGDDKPTRANDSEPEMDGILYSTVG